MAAPLMVVHKALFFFLVLTLGLLSYHHYGVEGSRNRINLSKEEEEDLELERQLKILNKTPIKTIHTESGDLFDCIDIHKQPALDHPLLKDHKIQMRPSSSPKFKDEKISSSSEGETNHLESIIDYLDCPEGTVPIRRTTKEDLIRAKPFFESYNKYNSSSIHPLTTDFPGEHAAGRRTFFYDGDKPKYYGAFGLIVPANPTVGQDQFSSGQLWVYGGTNPRQDTINSLEAGWAVAPQLFGDTKTRLFVYSISDYFPKGCYALHCVGFVQLDRKVTIGAEVKTIPAFGGKQIVVTVSIYQDEETGNWWLNFDNKEKENVGYWPKEIFSKLTAGASGVGWGGLVRSSPTGPNPPMGNGQFPNHDYTKATSVVKQQVIYSNFSYVAPVEAEFQTFSDSPKCYNVQYSGNLGIGELNYALLFGGPGGYDCGV